jgi:hypothetical protein
VGLYFGDAIAKLMETDNPLKVRVFSFGYRIASVMLAIVLIANAAPVPTPSESSDPAGDEALDRYVAYAQSKQSNLRGLQMEMEIDAALPKLQKTGKLEALRSISKLGQVTYQGLKFIGDTTIKNDIIIRYLTAEKQTQDIAQMALVPENYKFKYKGKAERNGKMVHVFQVSPRKKQVGLFKGELWLDASTSLPVRESGRFVKNPSIFLKKIDFVRDYEIRDGVAIPRHIESTVETRFWGPAQMSIDFKNISKSEEAQATALPTQAAQ